MKKFFLIIVFNCLIISLNYGQTISTTNQTLLNSDIGTIISVPINASNITSSYGNTITATIRIEFNQDVLQYIGYNNMNPIITSNVTPASLSPMPNGSGGVIQFNLEESTFSGFDFPNGKCFDLRFTYKGGYSSVTITGAEFLPTTFIPVDAIKINGSISGPTVPITSVLAGGLWSVGSTWDLNHTPNATNHVIIASTVTMDENATVTGDLTINSGAALTVNTGKTLGLTGNFLIKSDATGTGSFINKGTYAGTATVQRYVSAYTNNTDGWRFISSPVGNTAIGNFVPGGSDDFFRYNEVLDLWENYMVSPFGFTKGMGYMAAYAASATKSFSGTINDADVTFSNLSLTPIALPATPGWHLLGNPFTSAIKWNDGNWALSNVSSTAKVLNGGGTYTDLGANDIIPAMQGFLVQVSSATNAITIPAAARDHSSLNLLNKSTITERLKLTASSIGNNTYVESIVKTDASATNGFDSDFDANFISGLSGAPQLYTHAGNNMLSTNVLPTINNNVVMVPVSFVAGSASNYKLTADGINTFNCSAITLLDLKTNSSQDLMSNPVYNFTASASDNVNRFELYFNSAVGVGENNKGNSNIYSYNNEIFVSSADAIKQVSIYNTIGQLIYNVNNPQGSFKYSLNGNSTGYYIVKVITDKNVNSEKVFVK